MEQEARVRRKAHIVVLVIHLSTVFPFQLHHVIDDKEKIDVTKI